MTRTCDAAGCCVQIGSGRFLCTKHWRMLPAATQRAIYKGYRAHKVARTLLRDQRYVDACASALEGIAAAECRTVPTNSYRRLHNLLLAQAAQLGKKKDAFGLLDALTSCVDELEAQQSAAVARKRVPKRSNSNPSATVAGQAVVAFSGLRSDTP
jgi:hypothetical protein